MTRRILLLLAAAALAVLVGPAPAAMAGEVLQGEGSSWSANAMNQWTSDESAKGVEIAFTSSSSGAGRQKFGQYQQDFANSDIPFQGVDPLTKQPDNANGRDFAYMPIIAGGTSLMYHLQQGKDLIRNVRLSGLTVAKIFTGKITMWNDPAITADMNGHALPAKKIQVVVASGGSGTTFQFTDWINHQFPDVWKAYAGQAAATSYYPVNAPNVTAQGNDSTMSSTIAADSYDGAIGYVQYSYALNAKFPVAKILNAAGYYAAPTPYNVAVALTKAKLNMDQSDITKYLTQDLSDVFTFGDPRVYPMSAYSYMIVPIGQNDRLITADKAKTFADFSYYFLCEGQQEAPALGYSPLPLNLVQAGFDQVKRFSRIDPKDLQNRDPRSCDNPTFDPGNPSANKLAEIDPAPQACDKQGAGPCGTDNNSDPLKNGSGGGTGGTGSGGAAATSTSAPPSIDPETGQAIGDSAGGSGGDSSATASELAAFRAQSMTTVMGVLAAVEVVLVLLVPAFVARAISKRRNRNNGGG
ncbi:phosphate ABC transporter substrate-binding protein PstS [Kutzneria sp. CA-103260]|uniref:phosphate ABC transporter substrate-binding protein PstS n=1 Tax=Kutzneria sp. CA-103260 TaxID=2802641 RepID=UPI001BA669C0|nr:phosphate ABC transporter substrate-binding protein PstS [Kutzneria sp. CA-103260]QUQ63560.1 phosphate ABC transporter substrate-binding protein [Kutzneria sp. CA-103260]